MKEEATNKALIVVSSHVARGSVGNRAAVFALETLGFPVWAVPTVVLPWHPGHGPGTRIVPDPDRFAAFMGELAGASWLGEVGGILSGYLGDAGQAAALVALIEAVRKRNPDAVYLCDPVMGDTGSLYVPQPTAEAIRNQLMPLADIITPNLFELQWLTGCMASDPEDIIATARAAPPRTVLVTSMPGANAERIGNLLVTGEIALLAEHERVAHPPNGAGDLTAALYLGRLLAGRTPAEALVTATGAVRDVVVRAVGRGANELMLATDVDCLRQPEGRVSVLSMAPEPAPSK